ncbi:MAG: polymer-forming cytoskeletal protein [Rhodobacteraceae bacterium]|jgi:cytoskeletal protein CcmA (bactofilin family)|nr:polymer-forming cytoskeletal protein [Paracoccaceae bacterium]
MFSKTDPIAPQPAPARSPASGAASNAGKSILASDLRITGEITSSGAVEVYGDIDGTLSARNLLIGSEGAVKGTVSAETVEVKGKLDGRVSTEAFTLRSTAQVEADINYTSLVIESGAQIEGRFTRPKS